MIGSMMGGFIIVQFFSIKTWRKICLSTRETIMVLIPSRWRLLLRSASAVLTGVTRPITTVESASVPDINKRLQVLAKEAPLSMQFRGTTADECRKWQAEFAAILRSLLGPFQPPQQWKTQLIHRIEFGDHVREELTLTAEGCPPLPVYLLVPKMPSNQRLPGILALHGHGPYGNDPVAGRDDLPGVAKAIQRANYDYGRQLARKGYVVAVPCLTPFGKRLGHRTTYGQEDPCAITLVRFQLLGKLLIAENLRDSLWALELLARHPQVDAQRLGCIGLSYGGRMTMLTASLEPRIKTAVISGALNLLQVRASRLYSCGAQVIPGLLQYGDVPEIGSLIAPRTCVWEVGSQDPLVPPQEAEAALHRLRRAYEALQHPDCLIVDHFEGRHGWSGHQAYRVLEATLQPAR
jgi:dienelactone hydrolase